MTPPRPIFKTLFPVFFNNLPDAFNYLIYLFIYLFAHGGLTSDLGFDAKLWTGLVRRLDSSWEWTEGSPLRYLNWAPGEFIFQK